MKKKLVTGFLVAVTLLAAGCGFQGNGEAGPGGVSSGEPVSSEPDTLEVQALKERSLGYLEQFHAGDFETILEDATEKVRDALTKDKLAEIWADATGKLGEFEAVAAVEYGEENDLRSVAVTENYAEMGFQSIFTYDRDDLLSGFHIRETDKVEIAASSEGEGAKLDPARLEERSLAYLEQFRAGKFDEFYESVTSELAEAVSKETFAAQWAAIMRQAGPYEDEIRVTSDVPGGEHGTGSVEIRALHTLRIVLSRFVYNLYGDVSGVSTQFLPLNTEAQSTDKWEESAVYVGGDGYQTKLPGLLALPKGAEKPPVVLLVAGSGPNNMDEKTGAAGNTPFADLAHGLAERGVASLRFDKRTYFAPQETVGKGVEAEYLDDVKAAVELLAADGRVDGERIYLLGHSQGGMLGPMLCRDNPAVKGFISLAGSLRRFEDISLSQNEKVAAAMGLGKEEQEALLAPVREEIEKIKALDPADTESVLLGIPAVYWNSLNAIDSAAIAKELSIPMMILQGGADFQVDPDVDYPLWKETLAGKDNVLYRLYPELNHLFMRGGSKDKIDTAVYDAPGQMDGVAIADIARWVNEGGGSGILATGN